jgi:hypothetical protein
VISSENLFRTPVQHASAWIDRWSTAAPDTKVGRTETGHGFGRMAVDGDAIWIANMASETVTRIDRRLGRIDSRTELDRATAAIAVGTEAVWVLGANGWLWRFHPDGEGEGVARTGGRARGLACDRQSAWVLHRNGELVAIDQSTGEATVEAKIRRGGRQVLHADDGLIALTGNGRRVCRIATDGGAVEAEVKLPARGVRATLHGDALWVACGRLRSAGWGALVRVDLATMRVDAVDELPNAPRAIAAGAGHLWVACGRRGDRKSAVVRIEPAADEMTSWAETDWTIYDLAVAGDELLAACGISLAGAAAIGGDGGGGAGGGHHGGGGGSH